MPPATATIKRDPKVKGKRWTIVWKGVGGEHTSGLHYLSAKEAQHAVHRCCGSQITVTVEQEAAAPAGCVL